jgi:DNA-binding response OmpR family regulator
MEQASAKGKSILVVEDEPTIVRMWTRTLSGEGYRVDIAEDGKIAEGCLGKEEYDLYILDIRTPRMNGMELHSEMQNKYPELASRVLFTTGDTLSSGVKEFLEENGGPYLAKPFTLNELRSFVGISHNQAKVFLSA